MQTLIILVELLRRVFYLTLFISAKINMIKKLAIMPYFCRRYNRVFDSAINILKFIRALLL